MTISLRVAFPIRDLERATNQIPYSRWRFPAHEVGVKLAAMDIDPAEQYQIDVMMPTMDELWELANICNALVHAGVPTNSIHVFMPYVPYGRQDRVTSEGTAFSLQVFAAFFRSTVCCGTLTISDPHSQVTTSLLDSFQYELAVLSQADEFIATLRAENNWDRIAPMTQYDCLIAPDAGAAQKVEHVADRCAHEWGFRPAVYTIEKTRGAVGHVEHTLPSGLAIRGSACIVDDICDGGATLISLGRMLRDTQPEMTELSCYVTHGIFSKPDNYTLMQTIFRRVHARYNYSVAQTSVAIPR